MKRQAKVSVIESIGILLIDYMLVQIMESAIVGMFHDRELVIDQTGNKQGQYPQENKK